METYRNETITTKIRPIKKLCIIEPSDFDRLIQIIKVYSKEIGGILNIILLNNDDLFSDNNIEFVKCHDPDIVVNFSNCENYKLRTAFKTVVIDGKQERFDLNDLATDIEILNNIPDIVIEMNDGEIKNNVYTDFYRPITRDGIVYYLNFGLIGKETRDGLRDTFKGTIFESIKIEDIREGVFGSYGRFLSFILKKENNFLYLSMRLFIHAETESIYEINYNKDKNYKSPTIIFGNKNDIASMIYFWNVRATYPYSYNVWLPSEDFDEYSSIIKGFKNYCIFGDDSINGIKDRIKKFNDSITEVDNTKYYFGRRMDEWKLFEYRQNIPIIDNKFKIKHPMDKSFSKLGFNLDSVLEVNGLEELFMPKSLALGELFRKPMDKIHFPHHFSRISSKGLAFEFDEFEPYGDSAIIEEINLPDSKTILKVLFDEYQLRINETIGSQITERIINLISGYSNLELLNDNDVFELLVKLTPKRIQRLVKEITKEIGAVVSENLLEELLIKNIGSTTIISSNTIISGLELLALCRHQGKEKARSTIQQLYENKILLRGKSFKCPHCNTVLWYSLSDLKDDLKCYCCRSSITVPAFSGSRFLEDSFKLNELVCTAVDQGILPLLLLINFLYKQRFYGKRLLFNSEIYDKENDELLAEADLIFNLGRLVGLAEVKADRGFDIHQIDKLLHISKKMKIDLIILATLKDRRSAEVAEIIEHFKSQKVDIPIFILTKEALFEKELIDIGAYYRNYIMGKTDESGFNPMLVEKQNGKRD